MLAKDKVHFFFLQSNPSLTDRNRLKEFIASIFRQEKKNLQSINFVFTTDKKLLEMNKQFLKHDYFTDILTFDLSETKNQVRSEIYISIDRVRANALSHKTTFKNELHRVIFHGVLHLCGYKDKTGKQRADIRRVENYYLSRYFL